MTDFPLTPSKPPSLSFNANGTFPGNGEKGSSFRSGFVALAGLPNVGKSTFLNALIGRKLSIVTPKPQTTRHRIRGILTRENFQSVLIDTPGIHEGYGRLNRGMVREAHESLKGVDTVFFVTHAGRREREVSDDEEKILALIARIDKPAALVVNKIDRSAPPVVFDCIRRFNERFPFVETFPVSSLKKTNFEPVYRRLPFMLPCGPPFYEAESVTDKSERFLAAELIRERVFLETDKEIPYRSTVEIEVFKELPDKVYCIASIHVDRESQKKILLGKGGGRIKRIGIRARGEIETLMNRGVRLELNVKVSEGWWRSDRFLKGYWD